MGENRVSHYRIVEKLGEGGMGEVYLAEDTVLGRKVALKFLAESLDRDPSAKRRFLREARLAAAVEHPYVCQIFETDEVDGRSFIAMEHVAGRTLEAMLRDGPLPLDRVLTLATEIAEALEEAHDKRLIHRDLKPANIMITTGGHIKVMDFGIAKRLPRADGRESAETITGLTQEGATAGTLAYMSPEQVRGEEADTRSDIFSFGLVLYEMLTGVHPFRKRSGLETASAINHDPTPPLDRYVAHVPELLGHVVRKMLAKSPAQRYQSVHEVRTDLAASVHPDASGAARGSARPRRLAAGWRAGIAVAAVLLLSGLVVWLAGRNASLTRADAEIDAIAVLPFENLMGDPEQQYFVDGMHDAVIAELSKSRALRVVSRTSVRRYRETEESLEAIADALGVEALVEGSVLRSGGSIRVTAQLVGVDPERHLWASSFERELEDVLTLQRDVARAIAGRIHVALTPLEQGAVASATPTAPEAHDAYLRGVYFADQRREEGSRRAETAFNEAIAAAPEWAPPYAGLGELFLWRAESGVRSPQEALPTAEAYARRALELDDTIAAAHLILANVSLLRDWDWGAAEAKVQRTLELNPNSAEAHYLYSQILLATGRNDAAVKELETTMALEPLAHRYT